MARRIGKQKLMQGLINSVYNSAIQEQQAKMQAQMQTPAFNSGMTKAQIEQIYNNALAGNNQTTPQAIQQTPQTPAQEIPKLEDNTSLGNQTIASELERMQKLKAENKPRSESEQRAIDTYLADLQRASAPDFKPDYQAEIERMNALNNDTATNWSEGEINARNDYLARLQSALEEEQRKNAKVTQPVVKRQATPKKTTSEDVKKEDKPVQTNFTRTMSANEQRDLERAMSAVSKAYQKEAEKATQPKYDERGFRINDKKISTANTAELLGKTPAVALAEKKNQNNEIYENLSDSGKEKADKINYQMATLSTSNNKPRNYESRMRKLENDLDKVYQTDPGITGESIESALNPERKLTKEEKQKYSEQIKQYEQNDVNDNAYTLVFDEAHPDGMMVPVYTVDENGNYDPSKELTPEQKQEQQDIYDLKSKISPADASLVGMGSMLPGVSALGSNLYNTDERFRRYVDNAKIQNPLAYRAGQVGGFGIGAAESAGIGSLLEGTSYINALEKLGASGGVGRRILAESLKDTPIDIITDVIPQLLSDINSGKTAGETALSTVVNLGLNQGMNTAIPFVQNFGDVTDAIRGIGRAGRNATQEVAENALNPLESAVKVIDEINLTQANDSVNNSTPSKVLAQSTETANQAAAQRGGLGLNHSANNAADSLSDLKINQMDGSVNTEIPKAYDRTKIANKEMDSEIDSIARMFKNDENAPLLEELKAAVNEAQDTGSEEAIQRAYQVAKQLDDQNAGLKYHTKKGREINFGEMKGTYTDQVDNFEQSIRGSAKVRNTVIDDPELDEIVNNLFDRYGYTPKKAELVSEFKQACDELLKDYSDDNFLNVVQKAGDIMNEYKNAEEFISSYKGRAKRQSWNNDGLDEIMEYLEKRYRESDTYADYLKRQNVTPAADEIPHVEEPGSRTVAGA